MEDEKDVKTESVQTNEKVATIPTKEEMEVANEVLTENAIAVLNKRYFRKTMEGEVLEDWVGLCRRVANHIGTAGGESEEMIQAYFMTMYKREFLPNSPALKHFGSTQRGCGSACFVLPIEDSRRGIFGTLADAVDVQAHGGGTGFSFSKLRPRGDHIYSTGGKTSGPVSFMESYDKVIGDTIRQGGVRDGANMGVLRVDHPDILEFIRCKKVEGMFEHFNVSVGITDVFMKAVEEDGDFELYWINGGTGEREVRSVMKARDLWNEIGELAWSSGDPGLLFLDTINKRNPLKFLGEIEATNPCGEQPLLPYQACVLGSIDVSKCVIGDWLEGPVEIDYPRLNGVIKVAVSLLDNIIDANWYPVQKIEDMTKSTRNIGLGLMGLADLFIKMHMVYGSDKSLVVAENLMHHIHHQADLASKDIGKIKGIVPVVLDLPEDDRPGNLFRRNGALTTIAPTGTLSILADCSSGCEPVFSSSYTKLCLESSMVVDHPLWEEWKTYHSVNYDSGIELPPFFITAMEISHDKHIKMQTALQNHVDASVSKTINMATSATQEDILKCYSQAYTGGCKGITVYRNGCKELQALTDVNDVKENILPEISDEEILEGKTIKIPFTKKWYLTVNFFDGRPAEVFINAGKSGSDVKAWTEAVGRLISLYLKEGGNIESVIKTLRDIKGSETIFKKGWAIQSGADAVSKALVKLCLPPVPLEDIPELEADDSGLTEICDYCGKNTFTRSAGCASCINPACDAFGKCG